MVQRAKSVGKLGIQADHVKSEKLSSRLKPSGSLHQEGKTKGDDFFKRKIKKSRSLSLEGLNPSSPRRKMSLPLPGRPPPKVETPPRQSQTRMKAGHVLPNYMKSTSSSDARKENSQVTHPQSTPAPSVSSRRCSTGSPRPRINSCAGKYSSASAARNLRRPSSLKLVRTLTKTPRFKPARSTSAKKCTRVVVCDDSSIQKATCSSTLKETKYPEYIMLNPAGTEAEGTSVFKVCPFTYCSLNGHRHARLPSIKHFVAARRRLLKAQKSAKVVPVSPVGFCQGSLCDEPAGIKLDFAVNFFDEIYAKREKGSLKIDRVVCDSEDEAIVFSKEDGDELKGGIDHDKNVENCRDATETVVGDLDEVYSLIMIQKERTHPGLSHCDVEGLDLLDVAEDLDVFSADDTDDGCDEEDYSSSKRDDGETLSRTETEDGPDEDTSEYEEEKKQEEKEFSVCSPGHQEDEVECASDHSKSNQVSVVLNETVEAARDERSQTETAVSFEEIDGDGEAQTVSTSRILQIQVDEAGPSNSEEDACFEPQVDEAGPSNSEEDACFEPQVDVCSPKGSLIPSKGLEEEIKVTTEPLTYGKSIVMEEVGVQDEEETRAYEHTSDAEIPTQLQIPGTSSEDSGEPDGSITVLEFARGKENDESSLLISTRLNVSGDDDNLEGFPTGGQDQNEDHLEQSEKVDMNNAAEPSTSISVLNGTTLTSTKSKGMYCRWQGKSHEELSGPYMIWRINRREKCDEPDEEQQGFNPRDPNYLQIVPDPEGEKIDLRHQMMDDRRNSEEWMIDHALQRAVSKLAPARKKKVELLVEAFEKVMPVSQFETSINSSSTRITEGQPIQACS